MRGSFKLFSVSGINIRIHVTFPLILLWGAFQFSQVSQNGLTGAMFGVGIMLLLFTLVTLHELGHSFAAKYFGIPVERIILLPIGGVAQLKEMPRKPIQEFIIAVAGPAVNVVIGLLLLLAAPLMDISLLNPLLNPPTLTLSSFIGYLFYYNAALAIFNLLPAFPMDGGRILRSLLAMRLNYAQATKIAAKIGQGLAIMLGIYGIINGAIFTVLVAFFVFSGAQQEERLVSQAERLRKLTVTHAFVQSPLILSPYDNLQRAINLRRLGTQSEFPVVYAGQLIGYIYENTLIEAIATKPLWTPIRDIMSKQISPISATSNLDEVHQRMQSERRTILPVVNGTQFLGLISYPSLLRAIGGVRASARYA